MGLSPPRALTTARVWGLIAWALPGAAVLLARMPANDLAYHVRAGQLMLSSGHVLRSDPFTFTISGRAWVDQQWLAQILLRVLYLPAGWAGLVVVRAALVAIAFGVVYRWTLRAVRDPMVAGTLVIGTLFVSIALPGTLTLRPQLLAVPLFLLTLWILRERGREPLWLAMFPFVTIAWANLHGSFVLAPLLVLIAFIGDVATRASTTRRTGVVTVLCVLAPIVNPWGFQIYSYVVRVVTTPVVRDVIDEWQPDLAPTLRRLGVRRRGEWDRGAALVAPEPAP